MNKIVVNYSTQLWWIYSENVTRHLKTADEILPNAFGFGRPNLISLINNNTITYIPPEYWQATNRSA